VTGPDPRRIFRVSGAWRVFSLVDRWKGTSGFGLFKLSKEAKAQAHCAIYVKLVGLTGFEQAYPQGTFAAE